MKTRYLLLGLVTLATIVFAHIGPPYDSSKPPKLPLPVAYRFATAALGSATNQYYCVEAHITTDFGAPCWSFTFGSTNRPEKVMTVDWEGQAQEDDGTRK